uniref:Uncharacterized protein n=1 Tax=Meloidogyne enterolobii TaxID=390850 RepID=A0A6V7V4V4_MELEN|nr:unnamed protein product [Meloidogyne enterolobii]
MSGFGKQNVGCYLCVPKNIACYMSLTIIFNCGIFKLVNFFQSKDNRQHN